MTAGMAGTKALRLEVWRESQDLWGKLVLVCRVVKRGVTIGASARSLGFIFKCGVNS